MVLGSLTYASSMKFQAVRNAALWMMERFQAQGSLDPGRREPLIEAAAVSEKRRLKDDLVLLQSQDEQPGVDWRSGPGEVEIRRGPDPRENFERALVRKASFKDDEMRLFEEATLAHDREPYQETMEFTRFRADGIEHVSITILGDAVGVGGIHGMAEFLAHEPEKSWRERTYQDFRQADRLTLFQQGTY